MSSRALNKLTVLSLGAIVRKAKRANKATTRADGGGLTFTVSAAGFPAWVLRYRFHKKPREYSLTEVDTAGDDYGLAVARDVASRLRGRIKAGKDVARIKRDKATETLVTMEAVTNDWYIRSVWAVILKLWQLSWKTR